MHFGACQLKRLFSLSPLFPLLPRPAVTSAGASVPSISSMLVAACPGSPGGSGPVRNCTIVLGEVPAALIALTLTCGGR